MALMKKIALKEKYVQVPNETAKAVEAKYKDGELIENNYISLQALGLITNLWSYDVEKWELHKTELYKRYLKNRKTSVTSAWNELVEANYIIEFKHRIGKAWEYVYIYRIEPFSEAEKEAVLLECVDEYKVSSTSDFQQLKFNSSLSTVQNTHISNEKEKQDLKKEIQTNKTLNPKPLTLSEQIENLALPIPIKKLVEGNREKILKLNLDLSEIEKFYNTFEWIDPLASKDDIEHLNQWEFESIIYYIFKENVAVEKTTYGMLKQMAYTKLHFKRENALNS